jgi:hypothetical protein
MFKHFVFWVLIAACAKDGDDAPRVPPDTMPHGPAESSISTSVNITEVAESAAVQRQHEVAAKIAVDANEIVRFPLDSFPELPPSVRSELDDIGCWVPQTYSAKGRNVIRGRFAASNQNDWAALCSNGDTSMIVIVWGGDSRCASPIERSADADWLQGMGEGKFLFSRAIGVATIEMIDLDAQRYSGPPAPARDHDGIDHAFMGKASVVLFCHEGKWVRLQGAD